MMDVFLGHVSFRGYITILTITDPAGHPFLGELSVSFFCQFSTRSCRSMELQQIFGDAYSPLRSDLILKRNLQVVMLTCEERKSDNWWMFMYYLFAGVDFDGCLDMFWNMNRKNQQIDTVFFPWVKRNRNHLFENVPLPEPNIAPESFKDEFPFWGPARPILRGYIC